MSKELEALNYVWYNYYTEELSRDEVEQIEKHLNIVQDGLKRLKSIDNANPSEALECLERLNYHTTLEYQDSKEYYIVRQYIHKAQEQEKVLKIIKKKLVNIVDLCQCIDLYTYNSLVKGTTCDGVLRELTQEEFELLKKILR